MKNIINALQLEGIYALQAQQLIICIFRKSFHRFLYQGT